jgi:hypothetical protein
MKFRSAFDHNKIINESLVEVRKWIEMDFSIIFELLPKIYHQTIISAI